jgi:hypothetical protein
MADQKRKPKSEEDLKPNKDDLGILNLPSPSKPLREWDVELPQEAMLQAMEVMIKIARAHPDFEEHRLRAKNLERFYIR